MEQTNDVEINLLLNLIDNFNRVCASRCLPTGETPEIKDDNECSDNGQLLEELFIKLGNIVTHVRRFAEEQQQPDRRTEQDILRISELLVRLRTNIINERNRAEEIITYLMTRSSSLDDPCRDLLDKLKALESMYSLLKSQLNATACELQTKHELVEEREHDIIELSQRLVSACTDLERAKNDLHICESNLKRQATDATDAKAKCNELKNCADIALEQVSAVVLERDQAHKIIEHLHSRMSTLENENSALTGQLRECEKQLSDLSIENSAIRTELGRAAEKDRETQANVEKIMQECTQRVQSETERLRMEMQRDIDSFKAENDRLGIEITEWRLKYDQCQRDYRNVDAMYEQLHSTLANATQNETAEKTEAIRRAAAAECARDEALFVKQQLSLKVEKLEIALCKSSERCNTELETKQARIADLQRQVSLLTETNAKCCQNVSDIDRELTECREKLIEVDMQYRYKVKMAEENARATSLACDAKMAASDDGHRKSVNDLARELNARQSIINSMIDDKKRRCDDMEDRLERVQIQLREEQSRCSELNRVRAEQARRIASLEDEISVALRTHKHGYTGKR